MLNKGQLPQSSDHPKLSCRKVRMERNGSTEDKARIKQGVNNDDNVLTKVFASPCFTIGKRIFDKKDH